MSVFSWAYSQAAKGFNNEPARKLKDALRPVKHAFVGKEGIHKAIDLAKEFEATRGRTVMTVFDVGASIGEAAAPMAKGFPGAEIYCFEPFPGSFETLRRRTKKFADRIHYFNHGLYNQDGELTFYVWDDHHDGSSLIEPPPSQPHHAVAIPTRTLDSFCEEQGITHIDFMKVDVEGVEKEMLEGGKRMLRNVDSVFVEISQHRRGFTRHYIEVFEILHDAGFSFVGIFGDYFFTRLYYPEDK